MVRRLRAHALTALAAAAILALAVREARAEEAALRAPAPAAAAGPAEACPPAAEPCWRVKLGFYGDVRVRYENDFDSVNAAGVPRDDRQRLRTRVRLGLTFQPAKAWTLDVRAHTGDRRSQQSPHLTFWDLDGGEEDEFSAGLDRFLVRFERGPWKLTAGRHDLPFWKQNELFWDDDVTALGVSAAWKRTSGCDTWALAAGAWLLPDGLWDYSGTLAAGQARYERKLGAWTLTGAVGLFAVFGGDDPRYLLNGNGTRDYLIVATGLQARTTVWKRPLTLGADLYRNLETYEAGSADAFAALHRDERTGYVLSTQWGEVKQACDWSVGYWYAHIETLAVNASYAQDDWVRWGSAGQTTSSDLEGHEFRVGFGISERVSLMARLFLVEAITSQQDGKRFRLDVNIKL